MVARRRLEARSQKFRRTSEERHKEREKRHRGRRGWITLSDLSSRLGGSRMAIVEKVLNDFVNEGRILDWKFSKPFYMVLTDKPVNVVGLEVLSAARERYIRGRGA